MKQKHHILWPRASSSMENILWVNLKSKWRIEDKLVARISGIDKGCNSARLGDFMHGTCIGFRLGGLTHLAMHLVTLSTLFFHLEHSPPPISYTIQPHFTHSTPCRALLILDSLSLQISHAPPFKWPHACPFNPMPCTIHFRKELPHHYTN